MVRITLAEHLRIMERNSEIFPDGIPQHLLELKRLNPGVPIDPDTPPPGETVKAIRWLKQESLPCSLLGEWQILPEGVEV